MFTRLFAWSPGDDDAVPWSFVRLLGEPTLDSEWSVGTRAAPVRLCGTGVIEVESSLTSRAVRGNRGPGVLIVRSTLMLLVGVRHVH